MSHPLGLDLPAQTTFTGAGGATCQVGPSNAGTGGTVGWSGLVRYFDPLNGTIYLLNHEFRNNLNYAQIYDANTQVREEGNNNIERSLSRFWRPVEATQTKYDNVGGTTTPPTLFIDNNTVELKVASVSQVTTEQLIVNGFPLADNSVKEISGIVLGTYQSIYVKSTGAVTFTLVGFEEQAEIPS
jgi:hypothetical protein